jgi:dTDP-4-dehydrorhamnose reductase
LNAIKIAIDEDLTGLYHLVNNIKISKYQLLEFMNLEFDKENIILPDNKYVVDKSLINNRNDFSFRVKDYKEMIKEMKYWIQAHKNIYDHYDTIIKT